MNYISKTVEDSVKTVGETAKDAFYISVGLGVMGFQKAQVRRQEIKRRLNEPISTVEAQVADVRSTLTQKLLEIEKSIDSVLSNVEGFVEPLEAKLPEFPREIAKNAKEKGREFRVQVREYLEKIS